MNDVFDAYGAYYDLLYQDKDYRGEIEFLHSQLSRYGVPKNGELLELGCGTGKHAELLANLNYGVHGVDISTSMIEAAKALKQRVGSSRLAFDLGDVRNIRINREFDAIISLFHVVSYQTSNDDLLAMLETASVHLKPGGIFLFDCWYGPAVLSERPEERVKHMSNDVIKVVRKATPTLYPNDNVVDVHYAMRVTQKNNSEESKFEETHSMRYLFSPEVQYYLEQAGLRLKCRVEWMTGQDTGFGSWTALFIAVKA